MPRTTVARRGGAEVAVDTKLEEAMLATSLKKLVRQEQTRTAALREYAESMVGLRIKLAEQLALGLAEVPRTAAYRDAVGRAYSKAGVVEDSVPEGTSRAALGAAIRYHIAEVLRAKGLAAQAGIALESPSQRLTGARQALAAKREAGGFLADVFAPALKWMHAIEEPGQVDEDALALIGELESEIRRLKRLARRAGSA
jgi:hypothetical protein